MRSADPGWAMRCATSRGSTRLRAITSILARRPLGAQRVRRPPPLLLGCSSTTQPGGRRRRSASATSRVLGVPRMLAFRMMRNMELYGTSAKECSLFRTSRNAPFNGTRDPLSALRTEDQAPLDGKRQAPHQYRSGADWDFRSFPTAPPRSPIPAAALSSNSSASRM